MPCHRVGTGTLCTVDSRAYTNIQLKPKTGPNQVHVYSEDQIQQSQTKYWQACCKNVPWTRGTLFFFFPFFTAVFCEAVFASNFCQSAGRRSWVGSVKDYGWSRGFDNEVCIHTLEPNELKNKIFFYHSSWKMKPSMLDSLSSSEVVLLEKACFGKIGIRSVSEEWLTDHPLSNNDFEPLQKLRKTALIYW